MATDNITVGNNWSKALHLLHLRMQKHYIW